MEAILKINIYDDEDYIVRQKGEKSQSQKSRKPLQMGVSPWKGLSFRRIGSGGIGEMPFYRLKPKVILIGQVSPFSS